MEASPTDGQPSPQSAYIATAGSAQPDDRALLAATVLGGLAALIALLIFALHSAGLIARL